MKRLWVILLSICMLMSLTVPALAAPAQTSGAASTLKLESVDGTATLKDGGGKTLKTTNGSRLYNGYELATKKASYAYVSLDDTKAIKLDASTSTEVFQSGKKLEMKVNSGQMFFNVTAPLKSNESLNIRTSTMVTGVRGTSGWVEVVSRYITRVSLLEGELTITSVDPLTNVIRSVTIYAGQTATVVHHGEGKEYKSEIIVDGTVLGGSSSGGSTSGSDTSSGSGSTSGSGTSSGSGSSSGSGNSSSSGSSSGSGTSSGSGSSSGSGATSGSGSSSGSSVGSGIIGVPEIGADEEETIENLIEGGVIQEEHIVTNYPGLTVETLQEEDVPGFVAVEVEKDEELQQRIEGNSPLSVPEIIGDAEERLEAEEAAAEEQDALIQEAVDQLIAEEVDPLFKEESTSGSSSSSGGSSSGSTTPTPGTTYYGLTIQYGYLNARNVFTRIPNVMETVSNIEEGQPYDASAPVTVDGYVYTGTIHTDSDPLTGTMDSDKTVRQLYLSTTINLANPTSTDMADALATFEPYLSYMGTQRATLNVSGTISNDGTTTTMVVPSYFDVNFTTASLSSGLTLDTEADSTLNFNDIFTNSGTISGEGTMTVAAGKTLTNSGGTILIENTNSMHVYGTLTNFGQILVGSAGKAGKLVIEETGLLENNRQLTVVSGSTLTVAGGQLTNDDTLASLTNEGTINVENGTNSTGLISNKAAFTVAKTGVLNLNSTTTGGIAALDNQDVGTVTVFGTLTSASGTLLSNGGTLTVETGANLTLGGTLNNVSIGQVTVAGTMTTQSISTLTNDGAINGTGNLTLGGTTANNGTIETTGTTVNNGSFTNSGDFFSPAAMHLQNSGSGTYTDTRADNLYVMVQNTTGEVVAWGIPSNGTETEINTTSPFYNAAAGGEVWLADHTYTLYGTQDSSTPVMLPAVTAKNVTLDMNGRNMNIGNNAIAIGSSVVPTPGTFTTGALSVIDSSVTSTSSAVNSAITSSSAPILINLYAGTLSMNGIALIQNSPETNELPVAI